MTDEIDKSLKKRGGRTPIPEELRRKHCVSVRLNDEELAWLNAHRKEHLQGEYLRMAALNKLPPIVPEINTTTYKNLAICASNLNQISKKINSNIDLNLSHILNAITELQDSILGLKK